MPTRNEARIGNRRLFVMLSLFISCRYPLKERFNEAQSLKRLLANPNGLPCDSAELPLEAEPKTNEITILARILSNGKGISSALARHLLKLGFSDDDKAHMHDLAVRNQSG